MKSTKSTISLILDTILVTFIVALAVSGALRAVANLITEHDRPLLIVLFDWLIVVAVAAAVIAAALLTRRVLAAAKAEDERRARLHETISVTGYAENTRQMTFDELEAAWARLMPRL